MLIPFTVLGRTFMLTKSQFIIIVTVILMILNCLTIMMGVKFYKILKRKQITKTQKGFEVMCTVRLWEDPHRTVVVRSVVPKGAIVTLEPEQDIGSGRYVKVNYNGARGYILRSHLRELPFE